LNVSTARLGSDIMEAVRRIDLDSHIMTFVNLTVCVQLAVKLVRTSAPPLTGTAARAQNVWWENTKT
jgi:hypothetical protein